MKHTQQLSYTIILQLQMGIAYNIVALPVDICCKHESSCIFQQVSLKSRQFLCWNKYWKVVWSQPATLPCKPQEHLRGLIKHLPWWLIRSIKRSLTSPNTAFKASYTSKAWMASLKPWWRLSSISSTTACREKVDGVWYSQCSWLTVCGLPDLKSPLWFL